MIWIDTAYQPGGTQNDTVRMVQVSGVGFPYPLVPVVSGERFSLVDPRYFIAEINSEGIDDVTKSGDTLRLHLSYKNVSKDKKGYELVRLRKDSTSVFDEKGVIFGFAGSTVPFDRDTISLKKGTSFDTLLTFKPKQGSIKGKYYTFVSNILISRPGYGAYSNIQISIRGIPLSGTR